MIRERINDDQMTGYDRTILYEYGPGADWANDEGGDWTQQTRKVEYSGDVPDGVGGTLINETTNTYDNRGRLSTVEIDNDGNGVVDKQLDYRYDDNGIRVSETETDDPAGTPTVKRTLYLNDMNNHSGYSQVLEAWEDLNMDGVRDAGELVQSYTLGHDVISQWLADDGTANAALHYLLYDGHGSTRGLVDATGQPLTDQVYAYDAYGNRLVGNGLVVGTPLTTLLYSGEQTDAATGKQYLRARYYDPVTGRFNRVDPFAGNFSDPQSLHKYLYTHANPVMGIDPSGLFSTVEALTVTGISVNVVSFLFNISASFLGETQAERDEATAWAMVDLLFLGLPFSGGGSFAARVAVSTSGRVVQIAREAEQLSRAGLAASALWGYLSGLARVADQLGNFSFAASSGPEGWIPENQNGWKDGARKYQAQITGRSGEQYVKNGFRFDGFDGVRLLDAKWRYSQFLKNGEWRHWFDPGQWLKLAERQLMAANGTPIRWVFAEEEVANAVRKKVGHLGIEITTVKPNF